MLSSIQFLILTRQNGLAISGKINLVVVIRDQMLHPHQMVRDFFLKISNSIIRTSDSGFNRRCWYSNGKCDW